LLMGKCLRQIDDRINAIAPDRPIPRSPICPIAQIPIAPYPDRPYPDRPYPRSPSIPDRPYPRRLLSPIASVALNSRIPPILLLVRHRGRRATCIQCPIADVVIYYLHHTTPQTLKRAIGVCPAAHSRCLHGAIHTTGGDIEVEMVLAAVA